MEVDFVPDKYKESIKDILNFCFEGPPGHGEAFVEKVFTSENCLGSFDGDKLTALLYIYPYDIFYHGGICTNGRNRCSIHLARVQALQVCSQYADKIFKSHEG